jgi:hypothetical protein
MAENLTNPRDMDLFSPAASGPSVLCPDILRSWHQYIRAECVPQRNIPEPHMRHCCVFVSATFLVLVMATIKISKPFPLCLEQF